MANRHPLLTPGLVLRLESAAILLAALIYYSRSHYNWWLFAILFLVPDIGMVGYLADKRAGAIVYNLFHTYVIPGFLLLLAIVLSSRWAMEIGLIWIAHIGFDRIMGFGLKYEAGFTQTHLQRL